MGKIQKIYPQHINNYKTRYTQKQVTDVNSESEQDNIVVSEHMRAHRNAIENKIQILSKFFFSGLRIKTKATAKACGTCKIATKINNDSIRYAQADCNGQRKGFKFSSYQVSAARAATGKSLHDTALHFGKSKDFIQL